MSLADDFPGLDCPDCTNDPYVGRVHAGDGLEYYVACPCGEHGPFAKAPGLAVAAWEGGRREEPDWHPFFRRRRKQPTYHTTP